MTLKELRQIPFFITPSVNTAMTDPDTHAYIMMCLFRYFSGDYGAIPAEDTELNNADLRTGSGHVLARYEAKHNLVSDIYIESHFCRGHQGTDSNNTVICYCSER